MRTDDEVFAHLLAYPRTDAGWVSWMSDRPEVAALLAIIETRDHNVHQRARRAFHAYDVRTLDDVKEGARGKEPYGASFCLVPTFGPKALFAVRSALDRLNLDMGVAS